MSLQAFFESNPVPRKDGLPPRFKPLDITDEEIDHSLYFCDEGFSMNTGTGTFFNDLTIYRG